MLSLHPSHEDSLKLVRRLSQRQNVIALLLIALTLASLLLAGMLILRNEQAGEIIDLADADGLDLLRSRQVEQEVMTILDEDTSR